MVKEGYKEVNFGPKSIQIPKKWDYGFMKEYCDFSQGYQIPRKKQITEPKEGYIRYLYISDFRSDDKTLFIKDNEKYYHMDDKDIAVANTGSCGQAFRGSSGVLSNNMFRIEYDKNKINNDFLYNFLNSKIYKDQLYSILNHTGRPHLGHKNMGNIVIVLPSKSEQKKIADILSSVDKSIEKTDQVIEKTKELKKGLMQQLLTKGIGHDEFKQVRVGPIKYEIPISWDVKRLGDISKIKRGASPRPIASDKWFDENSDIGWVRISDITSAGKYLKETEQYLSNAGVEKSRKANKGEVILSICATVGKPSILDINTCIHDGLVLFRNNKDNILDEFLYYVLLRNQQILKSKGQTGTQANLNTSIVKRTEILLPPLEEQKKIANILSTVDEKIQKEEEYKARLERLKKGLMQKLLTGEVRVNVDDIKEA